MVTILDETGQQDVLRDVKGERDKQDSKWGEQNHTPMEWIAVLGEEYGEACQGALRAHFNGKTLQEYREEMVHVTAVAVVALESLDRQLARAEWEGSHPGANEAWEKVYGKPRSAW